VEQLDEEAVQLLRDIEAQEGVLRLDLGSAAVDHGDPSWTDRVYGGWAKEYEKQVAQIRLSMFGGPILQHLAQAVALLDANAGSVLTATPVGWTSIPVLNACAVRRHQAIAIALNVRLSTTLTAAAAINWDLQEAVVKGDPARASNAFHRLTRVLQRSSDDDFDVTLAHVAPYPTRFHSWFGSSCSLLQLVFILLHEIGHVALGHLTAHELWLGHPLSRPSREFFAGSIDAEYAADAYAATKLLDMSNWETAGGEVEFLGFARERPYLVPIALVELFVWFQLIAPSNMHGYYKIPRTHPHPLDRAQRIVEALGAAHRRFDAARTEEVLQRYRRLVDLSGREDR
jgi:hypothetical protein